MIDDPRLRPRDLRALRCANAALARVSASPIGTASRIARRVTAAGDRGPSGGPHMRRDRAHRASWDWTGAIDSDAARHRVETIIPRWIRYERRRSSDRHGHRDQYADD